MRAFVFVFVKLTKSPLDSTSMALTTGAALPVIVIAPVTLVVRFVSAWRSPITRW